MQQPSAQPRVDLLSDLGADPFSQGQGGTQQRSAGGFADFAAFGTSPPQQSSGFGQPGAGLGQPGAGLGQPGAGFAHQPAAFPQPSAGNAYCLVQCDTLNLFCC